MNTRFQAVIFDLDGTLLYTLEDLADSLNAVLTGEGLPTHSIDEYRFLVGHGLERLVIGALPEGLRRPAHVRPVLQKFVELYRRRQLDKTRPYPGIAEMLAELQARRLRLAVLSNKAHPNTLSVVEHFFPGVFEAVWGLRPDVPAKPDPAGARAIAQGFGLEPARILYLGDSDVDMKTAAAAGMYPVGAAWGYRPRAELLAAGAQEIIDSPGELPGLL